MARTRPLPTADEIKAAKASLIRLKFVGADPNQKTKGHPQRAELKHALNLLSRAGHSPPTAAEIAAAHAPVEA